MHVNIWVHLWGGGKTCKRKLDKGHSREGFPGSSGRLGNLFSKLVVWLWYKYKVREEEWVLPYFLFFSQLPSCLMGSSKRFLENDTAQECVEQSKYIRVITTFFLEFPVMLVCSPAFPVLCCFPFSSLGFLNSLGVVNFWSHSLWNRL